MNSTPPPSTPPTLAPEDAACWSATIDADAEPALLSRVLQRLLVQSVALDRLRYDADETSGAVRIEVLFRGDAEHAHLLARRWETLVNVHRVALCPARVSRTRAA